MKGSSDDGASGARAPPHFASSLKIYAKIVIVAFNYLLSLTRSQRLTMANKLLLPTREEFPNQPKNIVFPKRMFSGRLHLFQPSWFTTWCWLHYDSSKTLLFVIPASLASYNRR